MPHPLGGWGTESTADAPCPLPVALQATRVSSPCKGRGAGSLRRNEPLHIVPRDLLGHQRQAFRRFADRSVKADVAVEHGPTTVGARAGGIPEVIEEGRTGLLVPFGDAAALAEAIAWLLDHPAEAARMGARGRETTLARWTWPAVYDRVWSLYESCLAA